MSSMGTKLKRYSICCLDEIQERVKTELRYGIKTRLFSLSIPEKITNVVGPMWVSGKTHEEAEARFMDVICAYAKMIAKGTRKVIVYSALFNSPELETSYHNKDLKNLACATVDSTHRMYRKAGFSIEWSIGWEYNHGKWRTLHSDETGLLSMSYCHFHNRKLMAWTEDRETFFRELDNKLNELILKASSFFMNPPESVESMIDSGMLLLGEKKDGKE